MSARLVVVSNRVGPVRGTTRAGGLAIALLEALKRSGGLWFGWSGEVKEGRPARAKVETHEQLSVATLDLSQRDHDDYYAGFSNRALWPLFHYRVDLTNFERSHYDGYIRTNGHFASALLPLLRHDDTIWVHDYHFIPLGEELRQAGVKQSMGFFLHIPFPAPEVLTTLPRHSELVRALFAYDLIGFQSESDRRCFENYVLTEAGGAYSGDFLGAHIIRAYGHSVLTGVFPIGIDTERFMELAKSAEATAAYKRMTAARNDRFQIIGVDRLDYSKGLPERFHSIECLHTNHNQFHGKVDFLQIASPSRTSVKEYGEIRRTLDELSGNINGRFGTYDWTPIHYVTRTYGRQALAGLYRGSRVGLVTPLRDGMNLVAKEYVAAQVEEDPGVLVLSRFAGAAQQMPEALIVNPYDIEGVAVALERALTMGLEERRERWHAMVDRVRTEDVSHWRDSFLEVLSSVRERV